MVKNKLDTIDDLLKHQKYTRAVIKKNQVCHFQYSNYYDIVIILDIQNKRAHGHVAQSSRILSQIPYALYRVITD